MFLSTKAQSTVIRPLSGEELFVPTINQLVRKGRKRVPKKVNSAALRYTNSAAGRYSGRLRSGTFFAAEAWRVYAGQDHDSP